MRADSEKKGKSGNCIAGSVKVKKEKKKQKSLIRRGRRNKGSTDCRL
jgi:hypothetical protein